MSADSLEPAADPVPQSAAVVEDSPQVQVHTSQPERAYTVQYRETDFNFGARLMEEEGITFFFKHEDGKHTFVLADPQDAHVDCHDLVQAASPLKTFTPGGNFTIQEHRSGSEEGKRYIVTSITHSTTEPVAYETGTPVTADYQNVFTYILDSVTSARGP